ncbi:MAG: hypothetical protein ACREH6_02465 [Geminicoccaceae bacterium]
MKALTIIVLLGLLAAALGMAVWVWREIGEAEISWHGIIALVLGGLVTFALGAGLMTLVFISDRRGYDERAYRADRTRPRDGSPED